MNFVLIEDEQPKLQPYKLKEVKYLYVYVCIYFYYHI